MAIPAGLIAKSLVVVVSLGAVGGGSWVLWEKGSWTKFDEDVFKANGTWNWTATPTNDGTLTAETKELKIEASTTHSSKKWICTIKGKLPNPLEANASSQISSQLTTLKTALGVTNGNWNPSSDKTKETAARKFFSYCIKNRTWKEWWSAKRGNEWKSTVHIEIKKVENSNNYKFNEEAFKYLYEAK